MNVGTTYHVAEEHRSCESTRIRALVFRNSNTRTIKKLHYLKLRIDGVMLEVEETT